MKKLSLFTLLVAGTTALHAQTFNSTYYEPGYYMTGNSIALLNKNSTKEIVFSAYGRDTANPSTGVYMNRFWLVKTDSNGVFQAAVRRDTTNGKERIIETLDSNLLHISLFGDHISVTKYSQALGILWDINLTHPSGVGFSADPWSNIGVVKVTNPSAPVPNQEEYYVTYTSGAIDPTYTQDANLAAFRLDQNGTLIWHKIYTDNNRGSYNPMSAFRDYASSITTFVNGSGQRNFAIAGTRQVYDPFLEDNLFTLIIDDNGNLVSDYRKIVTADFEPSMPDILWDGDSLVMTYMEENRSFLSSPPYVATGIGLIKFDDAYSLLRGRFYYDECENYGLSITKSSDGNYLVSGLVTDCFGTSPYSMNPYLLKIKRNNLVPDFYKRYNVYKTASVFSWHRTDDNDMNYLLPTLNPEMWPTGMIGGTRLIRTDASGNTCGAQDFSINTLAFTPSNTIFYYSPWDINDYSLNSTIVNPVSLVQTECKSGGTPGENYYRQAAEATPSFNAKVVPTLLDHASAQTVDCIITSDHNTTIELCVYNTLGQQIYATKQAVNTGSNSIRFNANACAMGLNMIILTEQGKVIHTAKVVRTN
jgi:hypothetical protein